MISVPLPLVGFGIAVAAGLGFLAAPMLRRTGESAAVDEQAANAVLTSTLAPVRPDYGAGLRPPLSQSLV